MTREAWMMSVPARRGAEATHQSDMWDYCSVAVRPTLPTWSMSGSLKWPGLATRAIRFWRWMLDMTESHLDRYIS